MFEKQQWQAFHMTLHMQGARIGINSVERRKLEDSPVELVGFLLKTIQDRAPSPRTPVLVDAISNFHGFRVSLFTSC